MRDGGGRALVASLVTIVIILLAGIASAPAAEPDGAVRFTFRWSEPDRGARAEALAGPGAVLHLDIGPYADLRDVELDVRVPPGVEVRPFAADVDDAGVRSRVDGDGTTVWTVPVGAVPRGATASLRFACRLAGEPGAVASFFVRGTDAAGRPVADAAGVAVGRPGAEPARRHGALEYLAVPLPSDPAGDDP